MRGYTQDKDAYLRRLRRIEGQVRGIARMVDEDVYCIDVLTQVSAVTRAPQAVALGLLEDLLGACVTEAVRKSGDEGAESVREAAEAITRASEILSCPGNQADPDATSRLITRNGRFGVRYVMI